MNPLTLLLVTTLAAGCTTASGGDPKPATTAPDTSTAEQERPREIRLDDVDPCSLIPEADYSDFYLDEPGTPRTDKTYDSPGCGWTGTEVGIVDIVLVVNEGIEVWLDGDRVNVNASRVDAIDDFPAVELESKQDENSCDVAVDVADGQYLLTTVIIDNRALSKVPDPCEFTYQLAESAMSTLVKQ
jgi:uncharacterized protein DUF3558